MNSLLNIFKMKQIQRKQNAFDLWKVESILSRRGTQPFEIIQATRPIYILNNKYESISYKERLDQVVRRLKIWDKNRSLLVAQKAFMRWSYEATVAKRIEDKLKEQHAYLLKKARDEFLQELELPLEFSVKRPEVERFEITETTDENLSEATEE